MIKAQTLESIDYRDYYREYLIHMPGGLQTCDYWFIQENGIYHAYYLEGKSFGESNQSIGHLVSTDFLNWEYRGTVLSGFGAGGWPEGHLATGSVVKHDGRYYMLYTGHSKSAPGMGIAISDDLNHWEKVSDGPVISSRDPYEASYKGATHICQVLADPYIYPEAIEGYYYAYINSWAVDEPKNSRGCQVMFRSVDLLHWKPYKIAVLTDNLDRLETCQVWRHEDKWYMYFGGRRIKPDGGDFEDVESGSYIYMADRFDGPFTRQSWSVIDYKTDRYCYIQKQIADPYGEDVALVMSPYDGVLWPYKITYGTDGKVTLMVNKK